MRAYEYLLRIVIVLILYKCWLLSSKVVSYLEMIDDLEAFISEQKAKLSKERKELETDSLTSAVSSAGNNFTSFCWISVNFCLYSDGISIYS